MPCRVPAPCAPWPRAEASLSIPTFSSSASKIISVQLHALLHTPNVGALFLTLRLVDAIAAYEMMCKEAGANIDAALVNKMTASRDARMKEVEEAIAEAKELEGDTEVR